MFDVLSRLRQGDLVKGRKHTNRRFQIRAADLFEDPIAKLVEHLFHALGQVSSDLGQPQSLGTTIRRIILANNKTKSFQLVEETDQGRTLYANMIGNDDLAHPVSQTADPYEWCRAGFGKAVLVEGEINGPPPLTAGGQQVRRELPFELSVTVHGNLLAWK